MPNCYRALITAQPATNLLVNKSVSGSFVVCTGLSLAVKGGTVSEAKESKAILTIASEAATTTVNSGQTVSPLEKVRLMQFGANEFYNSDAHFGKHSRWAIAYPGAPEP